MTRRSWRTRTRLAAVGAALSAALVVSACTSASSGPAVTVTNQLTVRGSTPAGAAGTTSKPGSATSASTADGPTSGDPTAPSPSAGTSTAPSATPTDGYIPTKLKPGEKAPQFIIVSFDGVGWHEKWQYWFDIMSKVAFHFTGFLSGTYMLSQETKANYAGPGHKAGKSSINWNSPSDLPIEIDDLNKSIALGNEVGTHFNGHFCSDNPPGGNDWDTSNWNNELDQFFSLMKNVNVNNNLPASTKLNIDPSEIKGERTPCLEGHKADLFPALAAHGMTYDSSFTRRGISWPTKSSTNNIWQFGMAEFPIHGTHHYQITMDYNFYYSQRNASSSGVSSDQSVSDSAQVQATYQDMYNATYNGNRAPLVLGNHFNAWNNNAYSDAIGKFVLANCGQPNTYCVPFRDAIAWMNMQDPSVLSKLQAQNPELKAG